jgi:hypothetical protein
VSGERQYELMKGDLDKMTGFFFVKESFVTVSRREFADSAKTTACDLHTFECVSRRLVSYEDPQFILLIGKDAVPVMSASE